MNYVRKMKNGRYGAMVASKQVALTTMNQSSNPQFTSIAEDKTDSESLGLRKSGDRQSLTGDGAGR